MCLLISLFGSLLDSDDLFFVVAAAVLAHSVRNHQLAAFAAFYQSRSSHFPVCSSSVTSSLGRFIFRTNRHENTSYRSIYLFCESAAFSHHLDFCYQKHAYTGKHVTT